MTFHAADHFMGSKPGFAFKLGPLGLGYYADTPDERTEIWNHGALKVSVKVDAGGVPYTGLRVWPAAHRLATCLAQSDGTDLEELLHRGGRVLELGAGCGLVSAAAAALGGEVTASDGEEVVVRRLEETAKLNEKSFKVRRLQWGEESADVRSDVRSDESYDLILGADITYDCKAKTLKSLLDLISRLSTETTMTLLAHGLRNVEAAMFMWSELQKRWETAEVLPRPPWKVEENEETVLIFSFVGPGREQKDRKKNYVSSFLWLFEFDVVSVLKG